MLPGTKLSLDVVLSLPQIWNGIPHAYAEDAQAPASSFGSEKEGSLSKA